jgi:hypothetical protein
MQVAVDCENPENLANFWAEVLRYTVMEAPSGYATWSDFSKSAATFPGEGWIRIADPDGRGPTILFHRVPEAKTVKNRVHLDLFVTPVDKGREHHALVDTEVGRLVALGATHRWTKADETDYFAVLHDPEGNEFCVV